MYSAGHIDLTDSAITSRIKAAMFLSEDLKSIRIGVSTNEGEVTLEGWVDTNGQADHAVEIAEGTEGVRSVRNALMSLKR
jgi:hyperosmotically inducible protein